MKTYTQSLEDLKELRESVRSKLFDLDHDVTLKRAQYMIFDMGDWVEKVPIKNISFDRSYDDFIFYTDEGHYDYLFEDITDDSLLVLLKILENLKDYEV